MALNGGCAEALSWFSSESMQKYDCWFSVRFLGEWRTINFARLFTPVDAEEPQITTLLSGLKGPKKRHGQQRRPSSAVVHMDGKALDVGELYRDLKESRRSAIQKQGHSTGPL